MNRELLDNIRKLTGNELPYQFTDSEASIDICVPRHISLEHFFQGQEPSVDLNSELYNNSILNDEDYE